MLSPEASTGPAERVKPGAGRRLGVVGWPVAHSLSPTIQNAALGAAGLSDWRYQLLPTPPELLAELLAALPGAGFCGVNVTIPHKRAALALATDPTARARAIGAANTLWFEADPGSRGSGPRAAITIGADNTDAPALLRSLPIPIAGATALVLGAGGSARAAVWALLDAGAAEVSVLNRSAQRARELCERLGGSVADQARPADLLVNCTAIGLDSAPAFAQFPIGPDDVSSYGCVVDFVYAEGGTELVRAARERGVAAVDGLELLVEQGALSFERFTGRSAPLDAMRRAVGRRDSDYRGAR